jgi:GNAT superfamily N-acetyltransferase
MIQITPITKNNKHMFRELLPLRDEAPKDVRIGCVCDDTACGAAWLRPLPGSCKLLWLYVAPAFRRRGCGAMLRDAVLELFPRLGAGGALSAYYSPKGENGRALDSLFLQSGFEIFSVTGAAYRLPWSVVRDAPFFQKASAGQNGTAGRAEPLRRVSDYHIEMFRRHRRAEGDYLCADADYAGANPDFSAAYIAETGIKGLLLFSDSGPKALHLDLVYAQNPRLLQSLFLCAFRALRDAGRTPDELLFSGNEAERRLAEKLFGPLEPETVEYHNGLLRAGLRR